MISFEAAWTEFGLLEDQKLLKLVSYLYLENLSIHFTHGVVLGKASEMETFLAT